MSIDVAFRAYITAMSILLATIYGVGWWAAFNGLSGHFDTLGICVMTAATVALMAGAAVLWFGTK